MSPPEPTAAQWGVVRRSAGPSADPNRSPNPSPAPSHAPPRPALRHGDHVVIAADLPLADPRLREALRAPTLNPLIELGPAAWRAVQDAAAQAPADARVPLSETTPVLPIQIPDYVDFYASL